MIGKNLRAALLGGLLATAPATAWAEGGPEIVASIKPVDSLVAAVMQGVGRPHLIVDGGVSPHTYSMTPEDARALERAAAVFWVGPDVETFLQRPLGALARDARVVALQDTEGLVRLRFREGGAFEAHDHGHGAADGAGHAHEHAEEDHEHEHEHAEHDHDHDHDHAHGHGEFDAHYWLDPANAEIFVRRIAEVLSAVDPDHAGLYARNAEKTSQRLAVLTEEMATRLAPVSGRGFVVFHDAYQYLEHRFGLSAVGSVTVTPGVTPGAQRIAEIRGKIESLEASCIFAEPQFEPRVVTMLAAETGAQSGVLDPLGADLADGPDLYFEMMRRNAEALRDCLAPSS
jgi:zinc transport system substrate-binding protein